MRTEERIKREIDTLIATTKASGVFDVNASKLDPSGRLRLKKKLKSFRDGRQFLELAAAYMSTNPSREFVQNEFDTILNRARSFESRYVEWKNGYGSKIHLLKNPRQAFRNEIGIPKMVSQLKMLAYLLEVPVPKVIDEKGESVPLAVDKPASV